MRKSSRFGKTYIGLVMAFLYAPVFVMMIFSFNSSKSRSLWTGFTLEWYQKLFTNEKILASLANTLVIAMISAVIATVIGTLAAVGINGMHKRIKNIIMNITYLPIINPEIVTGVSLMLLFVFIRDKVGLPLEMGLTTLVLAHVTFSIPYVVLNVMPKLRQMDKYIYDAALDLGCSPAQAFMKVVIPEITPGIMSGFLMAFTFSLDDFIISYFVSGPAFQTLPIEIYSMARKKVSPQINALSTILFLVVMSVLIISNYLEYRKESHNRKESIQ